MKPKKKTLLNSNQKIKIPKFIPKKFKFLTKHKLKQKFQIFNNKKNILKHKIQELIKYQISKKNRIMINLKC